MTYIAYTTYIHNSYYLHMPHFRPYNKNIICKFFLYTKMVNKYDQKHKERL